MLDKTLKRSFICFMGTQEQVAFYVKVFKAMVDEFLSDGALIAKNETQ